MGEDARAFLESNLGRCLLGMAQQEILAAQQELECVDPTDTKKVCELQNKAWRSRQFEAWLRELVANGESAVALYVAKTRE